MRVSHKFIFSLMICTIVIALFLFASVAAPVESNLSDGISPGVTSADNYRLTSSAWSRSAALTEMMASAEGGDYRLLVPALRGNGCCCNFIPCLLKEAQ